MVTEVKMLLGIEDDAYDQDIKDQILSITGGRVLGPAWLRQRVIEQAARELKRRHDDTTEERGEE